MLDKYYLETDPGCIIIDTTWLCNLKCHMCHQDSPAFKVPEKPHISIELVERMLPLIRTTASVNMLGAGEPLMHPKIYEILTMIKTEAPDTRVTIISNGTLLTKRNIAKLIDTGLDVISVSMDGPDLERGHQDSEVTYANLRALAAEKKRQGVNHPDISIGFVIGKDNEDALIPVLNFGIELGINGIVVEPLRIVEPNPKWDDYILANNIYDHKETVGPILMQARELAQSHGINIDTPYIVGV
jgi:MoaA/NifB/PqqE/SkfB family radical SAM enzyme